MVHVNDDTNDELFRRAAEDYFLVANNPDWEKVLTKINTGEASSINKPGLQKKKNHYRFLYLFNSPRSIFRVFRFSAWLEKNKKKMNADSMCRHYKLLFLSVAQ